VYSSKHHQPLPFFLSSIKAGFPSPADDYIENALDLNELLIAHPAATFFVRVEGHSMEDALLRYAERCLKKIFLKDRQYKRAGILLSGICPQSVTQLDLFTKNTKKASQDRLMQVLDEIKWTYGDDALYFASEGRKKCWKAAAQKHRSNRYTTSWDEILSIKL